MAQKLSKDELRLIDELVEESERTRDTPFPPGTKFTRAPGTVVQSVRLHASELKEIQALSKRSNTPVSAIIRGWITQGLAAEREETIETSLDRVLEEVHRLRRVARAEK